MRFRKNLVAVSLMLTAVLSSTLALSGQVPTAYAADAGAALATLGPTSIADIAQNAAPAVVNIEVTAKVSSEAMPMGSIQGLPPGLQFFFGQNFNDMLRPQGGGHAPKFQARDTGSGFIVRPNGYIVTNAHVVKDAEKIKVTLNDKRTFDGKVVGVDYFSDLAVIKIPAENLPTLKFGTSSKLRPGDFAIAIGSPLGYDHTVTMGIISAVGRTVTDVNGNINFIQTDAAINPGNSGGPLLNLNGEVIGVNTAIRRDAQNIGFSIPVDVAKQVSDGLIADGKIVRPWLGITMIELNDDMRKAIGVPTTTKGVVIKEPLENSPAMAAGLQAGDIIQKIDGNEMDSPQDVKKYVLDRKVSDTLHFFVLRKGAGQAVAVNVGDRPDGDKQKEALAPKHAQMPDDDDR